MLARLQGTVAGLSGDIFLEILKFNDTDARTRPNRRTISAHGRPHDASV